MIRFSGKKKRICEFDFYWRKLWPLNWNVEHKWASQTNRAVTVTLWTNLRVCVCVCIYVRMCINVLVCQKKKDFWWSDALPGWTTEALNDFLDSVCRTCVALCLLCVTWKCVSVAFCQRLLKNDVVVQDKLCVCGNKLHFQGHLIWSVIRSKQHFLYKFCCCTGMCVCVCSIS